MSKRIVVKEIKPNQPVFVIGFVCLKFGKKKSCKINQIKMTKFFFLKIEQIKMIKYFFKINQIKMINFLWVLLTCALRAQDKKLNKEIVHS